jgi:hypothetical protein
MHQNLMRQAAVLAEQHVFSLALKIYKVAVWDQ